MQEETSCRGFGGVPQINQSPPKNGGSRGLKQGCETPSSAMALGRSPENRRLEHLNGDCVAPALADLPAALLWFLF